MDVINLIAAIAAVAAVIVAIVVYWRQAKGQNRLVTRQEKFEKELSRQQKEWQKELAKHEEERDRELAQQQQEWQGKLARRQEILNAGQQLSRHFTKWHDALRAIVKNGSEKDFKYNEDQLRKYEAEIEDFQENVKYEGPLDQLLAPFKRPSSDSERPPQFAELVAAAKDFRMAATDFKDGAVGTINDLLTGKEYPKMKDTDRTDYDRRIRAHFAIVHATYENAMRIIDDVTVSSDPG